MQWLTKRLDRSMALIEIGPSHLPIAPKSAGWGTTVVDHASQDDLKAKYAGHGVELGRIEAVDVLWSGGDLAEAFPTSALGNFDAIIASHVLEHMPDPIAFLMSAVRLLKQSGIVILAVPDKRYCFDFFQPITTTGDWLAAHEGRPQTHSKRVAFNHMAYAASVGGQIAWGHQPLREVELVHTLSDAAAHFERADDAGLGRYSDYHAWRFTPSSFELLILETAAVRDVDLRVSECTPAIGHEFFAVLERGREFTADSDGLAARRKMLLRASILDIRQQTDMLVTTPGLPS